MDRHRDPGCHPLPGDRRDLVADAHRPPQRPGRQLADRVVPRIDRELAGAVVLGCVHDMSDDTRISVKRQTARWDPDAEASVNEAMDFWSFAAAAANVV